MDPRELHGAPKPLNSFYKKVKKVLEDPVYYEFYTDPRVLSCGHIYEKSTLKEIKDETTKKIITQCQLCNKGFEIMPEICLKIKTLVEITQNYKPEVADHTEEAEKDFEAAKVCCNNKEIDKAIDLFLELFKNSPDYKEAVGYYSCFMNMASMIGVQQASWSSVKEPMKRNSNDEVQQAPKPSIESLSIEKRCGIMAQREYEVRKLIVFLEQFDKSNRYCADSTHFKGIVETIIGQLKRLPELNDEIKEWKALYKNDLFIQPEEIKRERLYALSKIVAPKTHSLRLDKAKELPKPTQLVEKKSDVEAFIPADKKKEEVSEFIGLLDSYQKQLGSTRDDFNSRDSANRVITYLKQQTELNYKLKLCFDLYKEDLNKKHVRSQKQLISEMSSYIHKITYPSMYSSI